MPEELRTRIISSKEFFSAPGWSADFFIPTEDVIRTWLTRRRVIDHKAMSYALEKGYVSRKQIINVMAEIWWETTVPARKMMKEMWQFLRRKDD